MSLGRQFWVIAHRWAGLTIALFLIVAGATGALLPFNEALTDMGAPWRQVAQPVPGAPLLDPITLRAAAMHADPDADFEGVRLHVEPGRAIEMYPSAKPGRSIDHDAIALNPYTGAVVHRGRSADLRDGVGEVMPFLYRLHYSLALGTVGVWAFGIAALIWTVDCFVGFYLTLPVARKRWWAGWRKAWKLRLPVTSGYKLNFDLHRAGGLWLWPLLFVFAWSSVGMNLPQVYSPVMAAIGAPDPFVTLPDRPAPAGFQPDWKQALRHAHALASVGGARTGYCVVSEHSLYFDREKSLFSYNFQSSRDFTDGGGWSSLLFYPDGRLAKAIIADGGLNDGGLNIWFMALHTAQVGGMAYRILTSIIGLGIVMLSVTGVILWMKKRSARIARPRPVAKVGQSGVPVA